MQSVHEVLTGCDGTEHSALRTFVNDLLLQYSARSKVIVMDESTRRRALYKKMERQRAVRQRSESFDVGFA
jgi:hypothetical protein